MNPKKYFRDKIKKNAERGELFLRIRCFPFPTIQGERNQGGISFPMSNFIGYICPIVFSYSKPNYTPHTYNPQTRYQVAIMSIYYKKQPNKSKTRGSLFVLLCVYKKNPNTPKIQFNQQKLKSKKQSIEKFL